MDMTRMSKARDVRDSLMSGAGGMNMGGMSMMDMSRVSMSSDIKGPGFPDQTMIKFVKSTHNPAEDSDISDDSEDGGGMLGGMGKSKKARKQNRDVTVMY
jgi:hypothetical protein